MARGAGATMPQDPHAPPPAPPWHLWAVGSFYLLLAAAGAHDQNMLWTLNSFYVGQLALTDAQIAYFATYPAWLLPVWTAAVWSVVLAAILLRSRFTVPVAALALACQLLLNLVAFGLMNRWRLFGPALSLFDLGIALLVLGLFLYARTMARRKVLR
jgi:hypothetical protein